eukprot:70582_1
MVVCMWTVMFVWWHIIQSSLCSLILNQTYNTNYTFKLNDSPYIVNSVVTFESTSNVIVETGVEIIFISQYIVIFGNMNIGCNSIDTSSINAPGLINDSQYVYVHGNYSNGPVGRIISSNNSNLTICNTKFEKMYAIESTSNNDIMIDNCFFYNYHSLDINGIITDSIFMNVYSINDGRYP